MKTQSSTHPTAQHHKCLATLLWKLSTSHCRCLPSLCSQHCICSFRLEEWRSEQQVLLKIGTYLETHGEGCRLCIAVFCGQSSCPHCDGRRGHHRLATQRSLCGNHHTNSYSHKEDRLLSHWQALGNPLVYLTKYCFGVVQVENSNASRILVGTPDRWSHQEDLGIEGGKLVWILQKQNRRVWM
jgi:hypothetical protein